MSMSSRLIHILLVLFISNCLIVGCASPTLNGTTQQTFYESMAAMQPRMPDEQFQRFQWAVGYLQVHDLSHLTVDAFYQSLDGLSAEQVIQRAEAMAGKEK